MRRITVTNHSLFADEDIRGRRFARVLGLVNTIHVRTREEYIRHALLVSEGGCFDSVAVAASEQNLRDLDFVARAKVRSTPADDSTWDLGVETWDEWSLHAGLGVDPNHQYRYTGFTVEEGNVLGRGVFLGFWTDRTPEHDDSRWSFGTTRFAGTRTLASSAAGTTRTGHYARQAIDHPFQSDASRFAWTGQLEEKDAELSWWTGEYAGLSTITLPVSETRVTLAGWQRTGVPGNLFVTGAEVQVLRRNRTGPPQQVQRGDYSTSVPAADSLVATLGAQGSPLSYARVGASIGTRRVRFGVGRGLDLVSSAQNVAIGTEFTATLGRTVTTWHTAPLSTYMRVDAFGADTAGPLLGTMSVRGEATYADARMAGASRWRDLQISGRARLYVSRRDGGLLTFITGTRFDLRRNVDQAWQDAVGGETGVRGYRTDETPSGSNVVGFVEQRVNLPVLHPSHDIGFSAFADVGRGWASGVPFALNTGWRASAGGAFRIGFPAGTGAVARIELARPIGPDRARGRTFRVYWSTTMTSR